jgi:hypothetical protein
LENNYYIGKEERLKGEDIIYKVDNKRCKGN